MTTVTSCLHVQSCVHNVWMQRSGGLLMLMLHAHIVQQGAGCKETGWKDVLVSSWGFVNKYRYHYYIQPCLEEKRLFQMHIPLFMCVVQQPNVFCDFKPSHPVVLTKKHNANDWWCYQVISVWDFWDYLIYMNAWASNWQYVLGFFVAAQDVTLGVFETGPAQ